MKSGRKEKPLVNEEKFRAFLELNDRGFLSQKEICYLMGVSMPVFLRWKEQIRMK